MDTVKDYTTELEEIMAEMSCPKDFACYKSNFEEICQVNKVDGQVFLKCMSKDAIKCDFSLPFEKFQYFCLCPLRIFAAKNLKK